VSNSAPENGIESIDEGPARPGGAVPVIVDSVTDGDTLRATDGIDKSDAYGRLLLYPWTSTGRFINFTLVAEGFGTALMVPLNDRYYPELRHAEALVGAQGLGQWASCR
jgi:micrococcal nuclease